MTQRDDTTLLRDIVDAAAASLKAVEGKTFSDLSTDHIWTLGLVKCLEIVGEAAGRLSEEFKRQHPGVPWPQIVGMRNRLVHAYFDIDYDQVWATLKEDLPALVAQLEAMLPDSARGRDEET